MSKLIEALRAGAQEFSKKETSGDTLSQKKPTEYQLTQQQLADIYFAGSEKAKKSDTPLVIRVVEKQRASSFLPWLFTSMAFLVAAFALFSSKRIFVDIKVIDEKNPYFVQNGGVLPAEEKKISEPAAVKGTLLPEDQFVFEGASTLKSSQTQNELVLVNSSVASFARANFYFETPQNLETSKIIFRVKGQKGGENLAFSVKDTNNIAAFERGEIFPFPNRLTQDWQTAEIDFSNTVKEFNSRKARSLRFEFGSKTARNKPGDTIFVKDIQIVPL